LHDSQIRRSQAKQLPAPDASRKVRSHTEDAEYGAENSAEHDAATQIKNTQLILAPMVSSECNRRSAWCAEGERRLVWP
jgi:hypothetical protein